MLKFQQLLRNYHSSKSITSGLHALSPALCVTGQPTCKSTPTAITHGRCLHSKCPDLVTANSVHLQQRRFKRKLYPDPFEPDPEYFLPPQDEITHLDLNFVPELGNKGPEITKHVQEAAKQNELGRLFAVVHIGGEQRKITTEDLVLINGYFPPEIGDKIRLEKVMLVGGKDFTLVGKPILGRELVKVEATVIEKTMSHIRVNFTMMKRFRRLKLFQNPQTVIAINRIELEPGAL